MWTPKLLGDGLFQAGLGKGLKYLRHALVATLQLSAVADLNQGPAARPPHQPTGNSNSTRRLTFEETVIDNSALTPEQLHVQWLPGDEDGISVYMSKTGDLTKENFVTGETEVLVPSSLIPDGYHDHWIRADQQRVLFATNYTKQYRYSYFADYHVLDVATGQVTPLVDDQQGDIQYAAFAPTGDTIAYVRGNRLHITNDSTIVLVNQDGGPDLFHGVPDWVSEEEVFADRSALWFSPDGSHIAYLSFYETGVGTYSVPYYMDNQPKPPAYPAKLDLRYPKAGSKNPTVKLSVLHIGTLAHYSTEDPAFDDDDRIIGEVLWMTSGCDRVAYRAFNRVQDRSKLVFVDVSPSCGSDGADWSNGSTAVVYEAGSLPTQIHDQEAVRHGWLDIHPTTHYVGEVYRNETYYIEINDVRGWNLLYLVPVEPGGVKTQLTWGEWEVTSILKVDRQRQLIYYAATKRHSTERHVYCVSYMFVWPNIPKPLVDDTVAAVWSASFSANGGYYLLNYLGPEVPYQALYSISDPSTPIRMITDNKALRQRLDTYNLPTVSYLELRHPDGYSLNVLQRLPPNFNISRRYPVLFNPYGGPGSQSVSKHFQPLTYTSYLASDPELEYITYVVDGRGTGFKGTAFRHPVTSRLGQLEAEDQIFAARTLSLQHSYIDPDKITIWGWSFGGYLTAKVIEANSDVFSLGLITAPVTDWRLYDSVYTERYMKLPTDNEAGYNQSAVHDTVGFKRIRGGFAIMHGTGDDNVHYQNTAALVDLLVSDGVSPDQLRMMAFTDSDHLIRYHGASPWIYRYLTKRLYEEKMRDPLDGTPKLVHQWGRRAVVAGDV